MVIRTPVGGGIRGGHYHSQSPEALFIHVAGPQGGVPVEPVRRQGPAARRRSAIPIRCSSSSRSASTAPPRARCPRATTRCRSARRKVVREGEHVTVIAWGAMLYEALDAAEQGRGAGRRVRGHRPAHALAGRHRRPSSTSVKKTGRVVVVHEAPRTCGFGAELVALDQREGASCHLEAPPVRVTGFDTPFPYTLENEYLPLAHRILPAHRRDGAVLRPSERPWHATSSSCRTSARASPRARSSSWLVKPGDAVDRGPADGRGDDRQGDRHDHRRRKAGQGRRDARRGRRRSSPVHSRARRLRARRRRRRSREPRRRQPARDAERARHATATASAKAAPRSGEPAATAVGDIKETLPGMSLLPSARRGRGRRAAAAAASATSTRSRSRRPRRASSRASSASICARVPPTGPQRPRDQGRRARPSRSAPERRAPPRRRRPRRSRAEPRRAARRARARRVQIARAVARRDGARGARPVRAACASASSRSMARSKHTAAHFTFVEECDVTRAEGAARAPQARAPRRRA